MIDFFIRRSFLVNLISVAVFVLGIFSLTQISRDIIPPTKHKVIKIHAKMLGASPVDMEKQVTFPLEEAVKSTPGLESLRSDTTGGKSLITLTFRPNFDEILGALDDVRDKVAQIRSKLPSNLDVTVRQRRSDSVFLMRLALENFQMGNLVHEDWLVSFEEKVGKISGVVEFEAKKSPHVVLIKFKESAIQEYSSSIGNIKKQLLRSLKYTPIGRLKQDDKGYSIELKKPIENLSSIKEITIMANEVTSVSLDKLASVTYEPLNQDQLFFFNCNPALEIQIRKDLVSDSIDLREEVLDLVSAFNSKLPDGLRFSLVTDNPRFIEHQLRVLANNAGVGIVIVGVMLIFFLGWRTALTAAMGIPVAYLGTVLILFYLGMSINLISVVAMIMVIGVIVDDAIIVSERYASNLESGMAPKAAASEAAKKLIVPVTGTMLTTIIAFSPVLLVESSWSQMFKPIPVVVMASLGLSWFECFYILPNHLAHLIKKPKTGKLGLFDRLKTFYEFLLHKILKFRYLVLLFFLFVAAGTVYVAKHKLTTNIWMGTRTPGLKVNLALKNSESLEHTYKEIQPIYEHLQTFRSDTVDFRWAVVGGTRVGGKWKEAFRYAQLVLTFRQDLDAPKQTEERLGQLLEKELLPFKSDKFEFLQVGRASKISTSDNDTIRILVSGGDKLSFYQVQREIEGLVKDVDGIQDIFIDKNLLEEVWRFDIDDKALFQYRLSPQDVADQIREFFSPQELLEIRFRGDQVKVYTEFPGKHDIDFTSLQQVKIITPMKTQVPIVNFGRWQKIHVLKNIRHEAQLRVFEVNAKYDRHQTKFSEVKSSVANALLSIQRKYPSYDFRVEQDEDTKKAKSWLSQIVVLCIGLIFLVLAVVLSSFVQPCIVGLAIPFGAVGIVWALFLHDMEIMLTGVIGILGVFGVAVNDSLIMMNTINDFTRKGECYRDSLISAASSRLRAIVLTTVTTLGGVFPMAYGLGGESGFTQPMAFSIGWGLLASTLLTLFFLPAVVQIQQDTVNLSLRFSERIRRATKPT